jgi:hypothetical protein
MSAVNILVEETVETVTISVTNGADGEAGAAATVAVGATTTGEAGTNASVTETGTAQNKTFDFVIPRGAAGAAGADGEAGAAATVAVGTTTTGEAGTNASVTETGDAQNKTFNFLIPRGAAGAAGSATVSIGTTTTGAAGSAASVANSGTGTEAVLDFTIPAGGGAQGVFYLFGAGQSNLTGAHSDDFSTTVINGDNPGDLIEIWNRYTTAWELWDLDSTPAQYGNALETNPSTGLPGVPGRNCPMFHLAQEIVHRTGNKVKVLLSERGGTNIDLWLTTGNGGNSQIWNKFLTDVTNSGIPRIDGAVWMHGENHENATRNNNYSAYSPGALVYTDDVEAYWKQVIATGLMDNKTPVVVGQIRDFQHVTNVRLGGPEGVNGQYEQWLSPSSYGLRTNDVNFITSPHRNLGSDDIISPDGGNHYGRRELVEMGRKFWHSSMFDVENPVWRPITEISTDVTYIIDSDGYYTDRINGKFNTWANFNIFFKTVRIITGGKVTVQINPGDYTFDITIDRPDITKDNFKILGSINGAAPAASDFTNDAAANATLLTTYFPVRITGKVVLAQNVTIEKILFRGNGTGNGLAIAEVCTALRWVGFYNFQIGVLTFSPFFSPVSNFYAVNNSAYGVRGLAGQSQLLNATHAIIKNTLGDYFASGIHVMYTGAKPGATFDPIRGAGPSPTGSAIY